MTVLYDNIVSNAQARSFFATSQITLTSANLFAFLNNVVRLETVSLIDRVNQEFFVTSTPITLVQNQTSYSIPYRSIGRTIREIKWFDSTNSAYYNMSMIKLEDAYGYLNLSNYNYCPYYYLMGDQIVLVPMVTTNFTAGSSLMVWYKLIPSYPCSQTSSAQVLSISAPNVTVNQIPSNLAIGTNVDFIANNAGCPIYSIDVPITNISGTTLTFATGAIPTQLAVGDWISLAQTSPVLNMIPDEAEGYIENSLASLILKSLGDEVGANTLANDLAFQKDCLLKMIAPRSIGEPQIIISRNNLTRGGRNWSQWYYGNVGPGG